MFSKLKNDLFLDNEHLLAIGWELAAKLAKLGISLFTGAIVADQETPVGRLEDDVGLEFGHEAVHLPLDAVGTVLGHILLIAGEDADTVAHGRDLALAVGLSIGIVSLRMSTKQVCKPAILLQLHTASDLQMTANASGAGDILGNGALNDSEEKKNQEVVLH